MAYFTAVLTRAHGEWRIRDVELDENAGLADLGRALRAVEVDDEPVIALLEHEDEWFALFRIDDGDDDVRLFVSDLPAALHSGYAGLVATAADVDMEFDEPAETADDDGLALPPAWAGDPDLLDDLGVSGAALRALVEEHGADPAAVLTDVGEQVGFADLLESLR